MGATIATVRSVMCCVQLMICGVKMASEEASSVIVQRESLNLDGMGD